MVSITPRERVRVSALRGTGWRRRRLVPGRSSEGIAASIRARDATTCWLVSGSAFTNAGNVRNTPEHIRKSIRTCEWVAVLAPASTEGNSSSILLDEPDYFVQISQRQLVGLQESLGGGPWVL